MAKGGGGTGLAAEAGTVEAGGPADGAESERDAEFAGSVPTGSTVVAKSPALAQSSALADSPALAEATRATPDEGLARGRVAWVAGASAGPLLLCVGGLHGNEPAGVHALEAVTRGLQARRDRMTGDFVAVAGNLGALAAGRRFVAYDLNRAWTSERLVGRGHGDAWASPAAPLSPNGAGAVAAEDREMARLLDVLAQVAERRRGPVHVLDLHTTSGGGGAFTTTSDFLDNRRYAMQIPAPLVLGLDEAVEGTLIGYLDGFGYTTAVFECGQHEEAASRERAAWATWLAVRAAGLLKDADAPEARRGFKALRSAYRGLPRVLEVKYRHPVDDDDRYCSRPGLLNFQRVRAGDVLGDDRDGRVAAPETGRVLMPLYQEQGEDGFFVVREFPLFWLRLSRVLRRLRVGRIAHLLPGVRSRPDRPGVVVVDRRVARWGALGVLRLLGFRPLSDDGRTLVAKALERGIANSTGE